MVVLFSAMFVSRFAGCMVAWFVGLYLVGRLHGCKVGCLV